MLKQYGCFNLLFCPVFVIRQIHPYEEPAFDIFEQCFSFEKIASAKYYKTKDLSFSGLTKKFPCKIRGKTKKTKVKSVAFACGSGRHLIQDLINIGIDAFITGEIDYHTSIACEFNNIAVIELGHKESEQFILPEIKSRLEYTFKELKINTL